MFTRTAYALAAALVIAGAAIVRVRPFGGVFLIAFGLGVAATIAVGVGWARRWQRAGEPGEVSL